jgi:hypothetical protein
LPGHGPDDPYSSGGELSRLTAHRARTEQGFMMMGARLAITLLTSEFQRERVTRTRTISLGICPIIAVRTADLPIRLSMSGRRCLSFTGINDANGMTIFYSRGASSH